MKYQKMILGIALFLAVVSVPGCCSIDRAARAQRPASGQLVTDRPASFVGKDKADVISGLGKPVDEIQHIFTFPEEEDVEWQTKSEFSVLRYANFDISLNYYGKVLGYRMRQKE